MWVAAVQAIPEGSDIDFGLTKRPEEVEWPVLMLDIVNAMLNDAALAITSVSWVLTERALTAVGKRGNGEVALRLQFLMRHVPCMCECVYVGWGAGA